MVSVAEASSIIQNNLWKGGTEQVLLLDAVNRVLSKPVLADRDFPPYDRVTMDGIAIAFDSYSKGRRKFIIEGTQAAGMPKMKLKSTDGCIEVMTGAILPEGTDTVIRYEDVKVENGSAEIGSDKVRRQDSIHFQGIDAKSTSLVLGIGTLLSTAEIPLLASVGVSKVDVQSLPKTAIISTGDELVEIDQIPQQHQIRRSNVYALAAAMGRYDVKPDLFHLKDEEGAIKEALEKILTDHDLIILSGGVSKGKFDFIPGVLDTCGIQKHFHQVKQRPGKPMWFGTGADKMVFALPGNPVSTFLCYHKYVEPWLLSSLGTKHQTPFIKLESDFTFESPLTYFLQVKVKNINGELIATPIPGGGSGDFVNLKDVDGFIELPEDGSQFKNGDSFPFISFRN